MLSSRITRGKLYDRRRLQTLPPRTLIVQPPPFSCTSTAGVAVCCAGAIQLHQAAVSAASDSRAERHGWRRLTSPAMDSLKPWGMVNVQYRRGGRAPRAWQA
jgi:hypothetical protein